MYPLCLQASDEERIGYQNGGAAYCCDTMHTDERDMTDMGSASIPPDARCRDNMGGVHMIYNAQEMEKQAALQTAMQMCAAARTAPKTRGIDQIHTMVVTGEEKEALAVALEGLAEKWSIDNFARDARNVRASQAVVLIGTWESQRGLGETCGYCHFGSCTGCKEAGAACVFDCVDLGIAAGSAVALAADMRVDTRIMYTVGKAALALDLFKGAVTIVLGIPVSISGKSPFFDRKPKA